MKNSMVFETTFLHDGIRGSYFKSVDDVSSIVNAFTSGHTVTFHFPVDLDTPSGATDASLDRYAQMSGYQPEVIFEGGIITPEVFLFLKSDTGRYSYGFDIMRDLERITVDSEGKMIFKLYAK